MSLEFSDQTLSVIGNNFKGIKFYDDDRALQAEIYLDENNVLNIGGFQVSGSSSESGLDLADVGLLVIAGTDLLTQERVLTMGNGLEATDGGGGNAYTLAVDLAATSGLSFSAGDLQIDDSIAGAGLTITSKVLAVGAGTLITVGADTVGITPGAADYGYIGSSTTPWTATWRSISTLAGSGLTHSAGVLAVGAGNGITVNADDVALASTAAGAGLTYTTGVLAVGAGTLITVGADTVGITPGAADYGYIGSSTTPWTATWRSISTLAGSGLTHTTGVLAVGAGNGITVNADDVALASTAAGAGLTYTTGVLAVGAGTLITVGADTVGITPGAADYGYIGSSTTPWTATWRSISTLAGSGLTHTTGVLAVGAGNGITVNADDVALTTPGTLSVSSTNSAAGNHTHDITTSSGPLTSASILATDSAGDIAIHSIVLTGDLAVNGGDITSTTNLNVTPTGNLTLNPSGDIILNPTGNDVLPTTNYDINLGSLSAKYLTLHAAELWVETLVAQETIATIGGRVLVGPTTTLIADLASGGTTMDVKHNNITSGDRVYLEANGSIEFIAVTSNYTAIAGGYRYSITRNLDGTGANQWYAGDAVFNTGTTGDGFIDLYSLWSVNAKALDYIYNYNNTGAAYSSNYADFSRFTLFADGANTEVNDAMYFGRVDAAANYTALTFNIGTAAVYTATLTWEFWNGAAWTSFTPTVTLDGAATGTALFKAVGQWVVTFGTLTGFASTTVNGNSALWVRLRISAFTSFGTQPIQTGRTVRANKSHFGPTIVGNVRNSATFNDWTEHWAIGNLNGIYGYGLDTYGVAMGKYADSQSFLTADATNGIRIQKRAASTDTVVAQWDVDGTITVGEVAASKSNVYIASGGVQMRTNTTVKIDLQSDGDIFIGDNTAAVATTYLSIFTNAQTYNTEAVGAGDVLFGDNSASKANIFWDKSAGKMLFRGGQTMQVEIGTDGALYAGAGDVILDANGIEIAGGALDKNKVKWSSGGSTFAHIVGSASGSGYLLGITTSGGAVYPDLDIINITAGPNNATVSISTAGISFQLDDATTASPEFIWRKQSAGGSPMMTLDVSGQLDLPYTGAAAGIVIGADTQLYRSAANYLTTPDTLTVTGGIVVGTTTDYSFGGNTDNLQVLGTTSATGGMVVGMFNATAGTGPHFDFYRSKNAAIGSATVVDSADVLGSLNWYGAQQTGTFATQTMAAQIRAEVDGTVTSGAGGDMPGRIVFSTTADAGAAVTDRLILDSAGRLKPNADGGVALGTGTLAYADLFLDTGAVVNFDNGDVTITHAANNLLFAGATTGYTFDGKIYPTANDGAALGDTTHNFSDLFLASGAVVNFNNGDVTVTHSAGLLAFAGASSGYTFDTVMYINETSNANSTIGLTINQGANTNAILSFKNTAIAHGVTGIAETDTFGYVAMASATDGGLHFTGITELNTTGLSVRGIGVTADTTKSTAGVGMVSIGSSLKSGTGTAGSGANANMLSVRDNGTTRFILDADGDSHQDVGTAWTNFDSHDDISLLTALSVGVSRPDDPIRSNFSEFITGHREKLGALKLVSFNADGHHFVNMSRLTMLLTGAVRQLGGRQKENEARLARLEQALLK